MAVGDFRRTARATTAIVSSGFTALADLALTVHGQSASAATSQVAALLITIVISNLNTLRLTAIEERTQEPNCTNEYSPRRSLQSAAKSSGIFPVVVDVHAGNLTDSFVPVKEETKIVSIQPKARPRNVRYALACRFCEEDRE
jgi:hypothetical protein